MEISGQSVQLSSRLGGLTPIQKNDVQSIVFGNYYKAIKISSIKSWDRISILLYGLIVKVPYFVQISIYNTNNSEGTSPLFYIEKISESFPFKLYWRRENGMLSAYLVVNAPSITADSEIANVVGNIKAERVVFTDDGTYTEITL